jgi:hypothetical protein
MRKEGIYLFFIKKRKININLTQSKLLVFSLHSPPFSSTKLPDFETALDKNQIKERKRVDMSFTFGKRVFDVISNL